MLRERIKDTIAFPKAAGRTRSKPRPCRMRGRLRLTSLPQAQRFCRLLRHILREALHQLPNRPLSRGRHEHVQQAGPRSGARRNRPGAHRCSLIAGVTACRHVLPVNRSITRMTELVKLAITCETMLRSAPNCAPAIGRMKRRPMRISIP